MAVERYSKSGMEAGAKTILRPPSCCEWNGRACVEECVAEGFEGPTDEVAIRIA